MSSQKRRQWTAENLQIIGEAQQTDATVSKVCRRKGIGTGQSY